MCLIVVLAACKSGDDDDSTNVNPTATGTGGTMAGTGGMMAGTGGMMGVSGMGGGSGLTGACADADISAGPAALHMAAVGVLAGSSPCGFSSCHMGSGKAKLVLMGSTDLKTLLVGKPSCEAASIPLVDGSGGETGLNNSWLWLKLTAATDGAGTGKLVSQAAWGTPGSCGQDGDKPFGQRMPWGNGDGMLDAAKLASIKAWICAGAPGPQ
jgi:hypothetical protein